MGVYETRGKSATIIVFNTEVVHNILTKLGRVEMQWKNTIKGYGFIARMFHIVVAFLIIGQLAVGMYMVGLPNELKADIYANHKTFGLVVLLVVAFRLVWRIINILPALPAETPKWQIFAARSLHRSFYVFMILIPITGWMMSTAAGYLPKFPGLGKVAFPFFQQESFCVFGKCYTNEMIGGLSHDAHAIFGYVLIAMIVIHTSIAIWHYHLKDGIFQRMFTDQTT